MFCNCKQKIEELILKIESLERANIEFLSYSKVVLNRVKDSDKKKFMYQLQQQDIEMIEEGKKVVKIRKILN